MISIKCDADGCNHSIGLSAMSVDFAPADEPAGRVTVALTGLLGWGWGFSTNYCPKCMAKHREQPAGSGVRRG